jgi:hypothetical protein
MKYNRVSVIYMKKKWIVLDWQSRKQLVKRTYREQAYHEAMLISNEVTVHDKNGSVVFIEYNNHQEKS